MNVEDNIQYRYTHRYPKSLLPVRRVRIDGFTLTLDVKLPSNQTTNESRRVFNQLCDLIQHVIRGGEVFRSLARDHDTEPSVGVSSEGEVVS